VVVEVKTSASPRVLLSAANQLQSLVLQQSAALGLLVFDDGDLPPAFALQVVPMVISLGTNELLESLRESPLSQVLWDARRDAVHRL